MPAKKSAELKPYRSMHHPYIGPIMAKMMRMVKLRMDKTVARTFDSVMRFT